MAHSNRMQSYEQAGEKDSASTLHRYQESARDLVQDNPMGSTLAAFGVGLAIGAIVGASLHTSSRREMAASTLGKRILDSLTDYMPDAVKSRI